MIALVRHPPVDADGRCYGRLDLALREPAAGLVEQLRRLDGILWTSPLQRCRSVAEACGPCRVDARLAELDFGEWEGRPWDAVPREALDAWAADPWQFSPPGGESGAALVARVRAFWYALPQGDHIVISHGGPLKVLAALAEARPVDLLAPPPAWGSVTMFEGLPS